MAEEARAMLDALMGADRNAPIEGASGLPSSSNATPSAASNKRQKRSCYDPTICPLYCAWSLSSQESPSWAESVAANDGAGGIDVYDLFTNTKSDLGPNPFKVDDHAREEFASLPDHEKRRLGYEDMLCRKLADLVRQCDRTVMRNKEKLRQEVARAMKARHEGKGRGNREDLILTVNQDMLDKCAASVAQTAIMEEDMAELVDQLETIEEQEKKLIKDFEEGEEAKALAALTTTNGEAKKHKSEKKKKKKDREEEELAANAWNARIIDLQKQKLEKLLQIQSLSLQLPALRDNTDNLLRQLQYLRSDTSTDKIVCEVSGNFMSSRDADERIAAHYAGKQYVGWKLVREKLKELQKRGFGMGPVGGGPPPIPPPNRTGSGMGPPPPSHGGGYGPPGGGGFRRNDRAWEPEYRERDRPRNDRWERDQHGGRYHDERGYDRRERDRDRDRGQRRY